jgi:antitoxin component YwqK of YwqJK toxin-antitoxin module
MKKICTFAFCILTACARAQDSSSHAIKVTTLLHEDDTKTVTTTDPDQHTSESVTYTARDKVLQKIVYTLDENNVATSGNIYNAKGQFLFKAVYKRDAMSRVAEELDTTSDGQLIRRFVYEYGANGKVSRIRAYDASGNEMQQSPAKKDQKQAPPRRRR